MNKLEFFREATLHITASPDPEIGGGELFQFLQQLIPLEAMTLHLYDPGLLALRLFKVRTKDQLIYLDKIIPLEDEGAQKLATWPYERNILRINRISEDPVSVSLLEAISEHIGHGEKSCLVALLRIGKNSFGHCCFIADGAERYTEEHAELIEMLIPPLSIATNIHLKFQKEIHRKKALAEENRFLHDELNRISGEKIIGSDSGLRDIMNMIGQLARVDTPVLINGETGVGKELIANAIQRASSRRDAPFVKVNCGAIPDSLMDSELFGHEKGAFTGAIARKIGRFERADGGTIFLDEIGELPLQAQTRLLRVLQNREIERVGGTKTVPINIRVIAATHRNLPEMVKQGTFREDLYFRLNIFPLTVPPLRHRKQDIPALTQHFIEKIAGNMNLASIPSLMPGAIAPLLSHDWQGNVRELENLIERALILSPDGPIRFDTLLLPPPQPTEDSSADNEGILPLEEVMRRHIRRALEVTRGKISGADGAAELLQIHPNTLRKRMDKLGVHYKRRSRG